MAGKEISQLLAAAPLSGAEVLPGDQQGKTVAITAQNIANLAAGAAQTASGGDVVGTIPVLNLTAIGTATGPVGNGTTVPVVTVDAKGRVTALTSTAITVSGADKLGLTPTGVKTANYTAAVGDLAIFDTTSGSLTCTLPTAPADGSVIGVKTVIKGGSNTLSVAAGGSDVFNKAGGSTTLTLSRVLQSVLLQYRASGAIWYVVTTDAALAIGTDVQAWNARLDTFAAATDTGTGNYVRATSPALTTPTGIVATDIASGTFAIARIPTGTTSTTVPLGGVITGAGPTGDASHTLALTYNAAGQLTAVTNNAIAIAASAVTSGTLAIAQGGTNAASAATARASAGLNIESSTTVADANKTAAATDRMIAYTSLTASRTVTLPAANAVNAGQAVIVADYANAASLTITITIAAAGGDTIVGNTAISSPGGSRTLISDGTSKWLVVEATRLRAGANLSDVQSASTSLTNLGGAPLASPTFTGTVTSATLTNTGTTTSNVLSLGTAGTYTASVNDATASVANAFATTSNMLHRGLVLSPTDTWSVAPGVALMYGGVSAAGTFVNDPAAAIDLGPVVSFQANYLKKIDTQTGRSMGSFDIDFNSAPLYGVANSGTFASATHTSFAAGGTLNAPSSTMTSHKGLSSAFTVTAGTVTTLTHISLVDPTGAGTITTQVGIDIAAFAKGGTNIGIRNKANTQLGSSAQLTVDTSGNLSTSGNLATSGSGTLTVAGNIGFNGKTAQATTGWSAPTATLLRSALANPTYTTTGGTGATAGAFDTAAHRDNIITDLFTATKTLAALITDLRANGVIA